MSDVCIGCGEKPLLSHCASCMGAHDKLIREQEQLRIMMGTRGLYKRLGKVLVWSLNNDGVCDACEDYVKKVVNARASEEEEEVEQ